MTTIDFSRSFLTFRIDTLRMPPATVTHPLHLTLNNARIAIDCRCGIVDNTTSGNYEFVLGASCKTERVRVPRDIWTEPNADFVPVFSHDRFLTIKTFDSATRQIMLHPPSLGMQPQRQVGKVKEAFDSIRIDVAACEGVLLQSADEVVDAALRNTPLVARTQYETERYTVTLDYPVKTINASERERCYQTDTGPVLFPDLSREPEFLIDGMELAFCAFNSPDWAEFLVRVPTPVAENISVYHYSRPVHVTSRNAIIRCERP